MKSNHTVMTVLSISAITLLTCFFITFSKGNAAEPFGSHVGSFNRVIAYSNCNTKCVECNNFCQELNYVDSLYVGIKWQCVEYVRRYYLLVYGLDLASKHRGDADANTWYDNAAKMGLSRYANGGSIKPQVGDILVSDGGDCGHIAIVRSVLSNQICTIQQNFSNDSNDGERYLELNISGGKYTVGDFGSSYPVRGWLRIVPSPRGWVSSSVIDNSIYTIGGGTSTQCGNFGCLETSTVEVYDPVNDLWTVKSHLNIARFSLDASVVNQKIYAIGGTSGSASQPVLFVEEYDPSSDTWSLKTTMPTPRWKLTSSVVQGKIYTIGGGATGNQCRPTDVIEEYDPVSDIWATNNPMPTDRWGAASGVIDGQIYVAGGSCRCPGNIIEPSSALEVYHPSTDTWTVETPMSTSRWDLAGAVVSEKFYAIGGWDPYSKTVLDTVEEYDPDNDVWTTKSPIPTARTGLTALVISGKIYTFGGFDGTKVTNIIEVYDPITDTWSTGTTNLNLFKKIGLKLNYLQLLLLD